MSLRRPPSGAAVALAFALVHAALGCGVRTDPRAPEDTAAQAPDGFAVERSARGVELSWQRPRKTVDGGRLYDLSGFVVERGSGDGELRPIATLDVTDNDRIRTQRTFRYVDENPPGGAIEYRVRAMSADGQKGVATEPVRIAKPEAEACSEPAAGAAAASDGPSPAQVDGGAPGCAQ